MDEQELFALVRKNYGEANTEYLKQQVIAAVSQMTLPSKKETIDGLLDWIVLAGGCGMNEKYRQFVYSALSLLKEQEPRVMTLKELQAIGTPWNRNTPPYLFVERRSHTEARWMSWGFMRDGVRLLGTMGVQNYGSKWRVWNLQPTPEQMRETPWEGDNDAEK